MTRVFVCSPSRGSEAQTFLPFRQRESRSSGASSERLRCGARCIVAARVRAQRNCQHRLGGCRTQDFRHLHAGESGPIGLRGTPGRGRGAGGSPPSAWRRPSQSMPMAKETGRARPAHRKQCSPWCAFGLALFGQVKSGFDRLFEKRNLDRLHSMLADIGIEAPAHAITPSTRAHRQSSFHEAKTSRCSQGQSRADAAEGLILKPKRTSLIDVGRSCHPATCQAAYDS